MKRVKLFVIVIMLLAIFPVFAYAEYIRELPKKDLSISKDAVTLFIRGGIDQTTANNVELAFWFAEINDRKNVILEINSPGGDVSSCIEIISRMNAWRKKGKEYSVTTIAYGETCSCALWIFASGDKGKRYVSKLAILMNHQIQVTEPAIAKTPEAALMNAKSYAMLQEKIYEIVAKATGKSLEEARDMVNGNKEIWMYADEAIKFGFADVLID